MSLSCHWLLCVSVTVLHIDEILLCLYNNWYVLMMFVGTEEAFPLQNTDLGLLKSVQICSKMSSFLGWNSKKKFGTGSSPDPTSKWEWSKLFSIYTVSCRTLKWVRQNTSDAHKKYTISRLNNQNFSGEGQIPPPADTPSPHPTSSAPSAPRFSRLRRSSPTQKSWLRPWANIE